MFSKVIVGLGNPGKEFEDTRHNAGFIFANFLLNELRDNDIWEKNKKFNAEIAVLKDMGIILVKPLTFMNDSGNAVKKVLSWYEVSYENLVVAYDDLDLKFGEFKLQFAKGPKVHNGLSSIKHNLKSEKFWNLRIGIENRESKNFIGRDYVLSRFTKEELLTLNDIKPKILEQLKSKVL